MSDNVKQFIEEQIHLIEQELWAEVFNQWYLHYSVLDRTTDNCQLDELFNILMSIDIDVATKSKVARESLIVKYMYECIQEQQQLGEEYITWARAVNSLKSVLRIGLINTKKLFITTCESIGLTPTDDNKMIRYKL